MPTPIQDYRSISVQPLSDPYANSGFGMTSRFQPTTDGSYVDTATTSYQPSRPITNTDYSMSVDGELRNRMYGNTAANFGSQISEADSKDGRVGWGSVAGSTISGAGTGAAMTGSPYGAVVGGIVGLGTGLYAKYESDKSSRNATKERKRREMQIWLQQKQWLEKNKDRLALQNALNMEKLQYDFEDYRRKIALQKSTAAADHMKAISDSINEFTKPSTEAAGTLY